MIKKISLLLLVFLFSCTMFAQKSETKPRQEYLTVKGLELKPGLTMNEALNHFLAKGFKKSEIFYDVKEKYNAYVLEGPFFYVLKCEISIVPTANEQNFVDFIAIVFPKRDTYKSLKEDYDNLKYSLSNKYYLYECTEKFDDDYVENSTSDFLKLNAIENNEAIFKSRFTLTNEIRSMVKGYITLYITHANMESYVNLIYSTPNSVTEQIQSDDL